MNTNLLKLVTAKYVSLQDTLTFEQKKEFVEKIKIAKQENMLYFLHISEQRGRVLNSDQLIFEFVDNIIKKKLRSIVTIQEIDVAKLQRIISSGGTLAAVASMLGVSGLSPLLTFSFISALALQAYQKYLSASARKCKHLPGIERDLCETQFKIEGMRKQIQVLSAKKVLCDNRLVRSKEKCKIKVDEKMQQLTARLGQETQRLLQILQAKRMSKQPGAS